MKGIISRRQETRYLALAVLSGNQHCIREVCDNRKIKKCRTSSTSRMTSQGKLCIVSPTREHCWIKQFIVSLAMILLLHCSNTHEHHSNRDFRPGYMVKIHKAWDHSLLVHLTVPTPFVLFWKQPSSFK